MPSDGNSYDRRDLLKAALAASSVGLAGCSGGDSGKTTTEAGGGTPAGNTTTTGEKTFQDIAKSIGFGENWKGRRTATLDGWPIEKRQQTPSSDKLTDKKAWKKSGSVKSAPWNPPEGWKDTVASEVDSFQYLNFGSMKFDPGTVATNAMFEERTGITVDPLEIVVDQAIPKETAFLRAGKGSPAGLSVVITSSLSSFVEGEYLTNLNALMPNEKMWDPYIPATKTMKYKGDLWAGPLYLEGSLVHTRPDLMKNQGVSQDTINKIMNGKWTWDDLETVMKAFKGTDVYAWAYRGSSRTYTFRDWLKMYYQAGGSLVDQNGNVKVNDKAGKVALKKMIEWREKGWVPNEVVSYGQGDLADGFLSGQFAMVPVFGDLMVRALDTYKKGKEYRPTLSPKGGNEAPNPKRRGIASPNGVAINGAAPKKKKAAVALWLDACLSYPNSWWQYAVEGNQSYHKSVYDHAAQTGTVPFSKIKGEQVKINKAEVFPQQRPIRQHISQNVQKAIAGDMSAKKALNQAQSFIDTVLGQ